MEPKIITLQKLMIVGVQTFGNAEDGSAPQMWDVLMSNDINIPKRINKNISYGIETYTKEMETSKNWFYMAGVEVDSFDNMPIQMSAKVIPENTYACFEFKGAIPQKLGEFFQKIYIQWLPNSGYEQAGPYDIERYDERFLGVDNEESMLEILIPIRQT